MSFLDRFRTPAPSPVPVPANGQPKLPPSETLTVELADLISRLPAQHVAPGNHDLHQLVKFDIAELAGQIAKGEPKVRLATICQQLPGVFKRDFKPADDMEIRFPWRRLLELVHAAERANPQPGLSTTGAQQLARLLRTQRREEPSKSAPPAKSSIWRFTPAGQEAAAGAERAIEAKSSEPTAVPAPADPAPQGLDELESAIQDMVDNKFPFTPEGHRTLLQQFEQAQKEIADLTHERNRLQAELDRMRTARL